MASKNDNETKTPSDPRCTWAFILGILAVIASMAHAREAFDGVAHVIESLRGLPIAQAATLDSTLDSIDKGTPTPTPTGKGTPTPTPTVACLGSGCPGFPTPIVHATSFPAVP